MTDHTAQTPPRPTPEVTVASPADLPVADVSVAPLPTQQTLRRRQSIPVQAGRFAVFNARIMRMVLKGHHDAGSTPFN